jgi:hypothetical protein
VPGQGTSPDSTGWLNPSSITGYPANIPHEIVTKRVRDPLAISDEEALPGRDWQQLGYEAAEPLGGFDTKFKPEAALHSA